MVMWLYNWLTIYCPQGLDRRLKNVTEALDKVFDAIIREHEQVDIRQQGHHRDFVDTLLSLMNQPMNPHDEQICTIDRESIKAIMLDMFAGASDTSSAAIEWSLSELLRHPRAMKHLQEELRSVVGMKIKWWRKQIWKSYHTWIWW